MLQVLGSAGVPPSSSSSSSSCLHTDRICPQRSNRCVRHSRQTARAVTRHIPETCRHRYCSSPLLMPSFDGKLWAVRNAETTTVHLSRLAIMIRRPQQLHRSIQRRTRPSTASAKVSTALTFPSRREAHARPRGAAQRGRCRAAGAPPIRLGGRSCEHSAAPPWRCAPRPILDVREPPPPRHPRSEGLLAAPGANGAQRQQQQQQQQSSDVGGDFSREEAALRRWVGGDRRRRRHCSRRPPTTLPRCPSPS